MNTGQAAIDPATGDDNGQSEPRLSSAAVLIVDDYAPNLTALRALMLPIAPVTAVDSGAKALEEIRQREYAVVVLDIHMPRMGGIEVARRIRGGDHGAQTPIIFLTSAENDAAAILDGYAAGAVDYLRRPFEPTILQSKVSIFVELHERREQARHEAAARTRLEAERAAAEQAIRDKDQFLSVLSHELRTPLTSILLWSDILLHKDLGPETIRRGLETVDICARHEARMVENVLEMSRLLTGSISLDLTAVDVNDVLADALADLAGLASERQVRIAFTPEPPAWPTRGDGPRLRQIVRNVLENAVKFTPAGGRVDIAVDDCPSGLTIRVDDTGVGFSPEMGAQLFSRFKQTTPISTRARGGIGLGLAVAKELIQLHGGALAAKSRGLGHGASFSIMLPHPLPSSVEAGS